MTPNTSSTNLHENIVEFPENIDTPNKFILNKKKLMLDGQSYDFFKQKHKVNYKLVYFLTAAPILILFAGIFIFNTLFGLSKISTFTKIFLFISCSFFVGLVLHHLQNIIHAGIHFNLHENKKINDKICNLLGLFTATEINQVRKIHMTHHTKNGTIDDTEYSYFFPLSLKRIFSYFSGIEIFKYLFSLEKKINENENIKLSLIDKVKYILNFQRFCSLVLHLSVITIFIFYFKNFYLAFAWIYGFFAFLPFFNSIQNILEHGDEKKVRNSEEKYEIRPINRNFSSNFLSKYIFGNFGSNKHAIHHWDPSIHFLNLEKTEKFLEKTDIKDIIVKKKATYLNTLKKILFE